MFWDVYAFFSSVLFSFILKHQVNDKITVIDKAVIPALRIFEFENLDVFKTV